MHFLRITDPKDPTQWVRYDPETRIVSAYRYVRDPYNITYVTRFRAEDLLVSIMELQEDGSAALSRRK